MGVGGGGTRNVQRAPIYTEGVHFQFVWANLPCLLQVCKAKTLVCEISLLPNAWLTRMNPEIAYLATSG